MTEAKDIHNYEGRLNAYLRRLEKEKFSEDDRNLISGYIQQCRAQGISLGRLFKLAWSLFAIRRYAPHDFGKCTRPDIERLVASINSAEKYSPNTKSDLKKIVKKFYKYVRYGNADKSTPYPPEVAWIDTNIKRHELREPEVLTEEEGKAMISSADYLRDKAIIAFLFEGGFRIGEVLHMTVGDIRFDENGAVASVYGKTGPRPVRLVTSAPVLSLYLGEHPKRNDPSAPLWYHLRYGVQRGFRALTYRDVYGMLRTVGKKAGVQKPIHPHIFRHSAATRDSSYGLNERILEIKFGWTKGSKMAARYTHIQDQQVVDNALLSVYAGKETAPPEPKFRPTACPRCKDQNTVGVQYCGKCGCPLDIAELTKASVSPEAIELHDLREQMKLLSKELKENEKRVLFMLAEKTEEIVDDSKRLPRRMRERFLDEHGIVVD